MASLRRAAASGKAAEAFDLIVDNTVPIADLARHFGRSEAFIVGVVEAITNDDTFSSSWQQEPPPAGDVEDYEHGFRLGLSVVDALNGIAEG
jgi:hypothetical protein